MMMRKLVPWFLMVSLAGCAAAPDEAWFRITEIRTSGGTASVAIFPVDLQEDTSETVDLVLQNTTTIVGSSGSSGVGIDVHTVRLEYRYGALPLPVYEFPIAFFLPAPGSGASASGTLQDLPIAPSVLKAWLLDPANFPAEVAAGSFLVETRIILRGRTDEGRSLETEASVTLAFQ